jgi:hypothetical protein
VQRCIRYGCPNTGRFESASAAAGDVGRLRLSPTYAPKISDVEYVVSSCTTSLDCS